MNTEASTHNASNPANVEFFEILSSEDTPGAKVNKLEKLAKAQKEAASALMVQATSILKVAEGIRTMNPGIEAQLEGSSFPVAPVSVTSTTPEEAERPNTTEAIRRVMQDGGVWSIGELVEELLRRQWGPVEAENPARAVEAALSRLRNKAGDVERVGRGKYRYKNFLSLEAVGNPQSVLT